MGMSGPMEGTATEASWEVGAVLVEHLPAAVVVPWAAVAMVEASSAVAVKVAVGGAAVVMGGAATEGSWEVGAVLVEHPSAAVVVPWAAVAMAQGDVLVAKA